MQTHPTIDKVFKNIGQNVTAAAVLRVFEEGGVNIAHPSSLEDFADYESLLEEPQDGRTPVGLPIVQPLKRGDTGQLVGALQRALNAAGDVLDTDGIFGGGTEDAVRRYQQDHAIPDPDGVAGVHTQQALGCVVGMGIDVYSGTREVKWGKVKESGIELAYAKGFQKVADPLIRQNIEGCRAADMPLGSYLFDDPRLSPAEIVGGFLDAVGRPYSLDLPPVLDQETGTSEEVRAGHWTVARQRQLLARSIEILDRLAQATGRFPGFYTSPRRIRNFLAGGEGLPDHAWPWWVAYNSRVDTGPVDPWEEWLLRQFTSRGRVQFGVDGILPGRKFPEALDCDWVAPGALERLLAL